MLFNGTLKTTNSIRQTIRDHYRCDENEIINHLIPLAEISVDAKSRAWEYARQMVVNIRQDQIGKGGVDALLNEFALSTDEGVVLMCLAEALLRVPDKITADNLIRDKLANGDWSAHLGNSESIFVNASSWGLLMTGKLVNYTDKQKKFQFNLLKRTVGRLGEPVIRKAVRYAMKIMGTQFVMGRTINEAVKRAVAQESNGYTYSYDMLGEGARTMQDADRYFDAYVDAIEAIGKAANGRGPQKSPGISIKLSAIHPRYEFSHRDRVMDELVPRLKTLAMAAKKWNIGFTVDAEEADRLDISMDVIEAVFLDSDLDGWNGFGIAVQAYQKRAIFVIEWIRDITTRVNRQMMVRLVKGAYWDSEVKNSQVECLPDFPVFTRKPSTDVSYQACAKKLLEYRDSIYPQFATHNAYTVATILEMIDGNRSGFEFQRLHGMGESLYNQVVQGEKISCRVYAPVGAHEDLLAYLVRRLLENGANSSFVNNIVDEDIPVESLLADPVEIVKAWSDKYNSQILMPIDLFGDERANSKGIDLTDVDLVEVMKVNLDQWAKDNLITADQVPNGSKPVTNPANLSEIIGYITHADEEEMNQMVSRSEQAFVTWSQVPVADRAQVLLKTADLLEEHRDELIAICIKEAGKIPVDGVSEVREAVDFCRYYAARGTELMAKPDLESRGVILCISPWNFPLAIFLGQVAAAIVTGNTVIAKPAEQTSLIALRTIELMKQAGLPQDVVQAVIARGSKVGQIIIPDERIKGVMFTGSTETGTTIAQTLAARKGDPVPLIAETGGQNCMIVDSTALPEQVVDDVVSSGFQSAGQRCSALRVLFIQEDIADKVIAMIKGAMLELHVGNPEFFSTDVGPVIDSKAHKALTDHVEYLAGLENSGQAKLHYTCQLPEMGDTGHYFFAPRLYEISDLSVLKQEVFGPCVHVIRFKGADIEQVIDEVNSTGFGLTMGIHTRIDQKGEYLAQRSRAGNVYINRNMIGAVVGVQPFGGRGLSGTGPKAGGPMYLTRLVKETNSEVTPALTDHTLEVLTAMFKSESSNHTVIDTMMLRGKQVGTDWAYSDLNTRISVLRQLLAKTAAHPEFKSQADLAQAITAASSQLISIEKKLIKPTQLPGPTGESNTIQFESRGCLAIVRDQDTSFKFWFMSVISALATGNTVITAVSEEFVVQAQAIRDSLSSIGLVQGIYQVTKLAQLELVNKHHCLAGTVVDSQSGILHLVNQQLAARQGAILPLITALSDQVLFERLVTEKTISVDTTAAGGNASLMTMEIED
ncbi:MAG: bifunctional proline dehydrogenase/L-glutamate gamma-semialdehyde dehydrogenase PutA [Gammaproteobacteria bacterium]|nr:bifunctional proline dehydrogenase/L-glutamate gamma-semialdehyde dehydrogenase PutA [Gammaproteobacteria bacterium]